VFLQPRLRILQILRSWQGLEVRRGEVRHERTRRFEALIEVDRTNQGLERIGQNRLTAKTAGLEFTGTELQLIAERNRLRDARERLRTDETRPQTTQLTLGAVRKP
jgi:hypothetical protein